MKMKKALSILLVACMCVGLLAGCQWLPTTPTESTDVAVEEVKINLSTVTIKWAMSTRSKHRSRKGRLLAKVAGRVGSNL